MYYVVMGLCQLLLLDELKELQLLKVDQNRLIQLTASIGG